MLGHFQRGVLPVRTALGFGNECGLTSAVSRPRAYNNSVLLGSRMLDLKRPVICGN